ncbi:unnamed protein product [Owenia fusiformis]|uniref:Uncharacterized protein n=1 Tax=Owenia fusiformis TaxID=6347 RepID=A0A8J1UW95_OWEFU|nr:unnamed protein product [Owenia fusiformis]
MENNRIEIQRYISLCVGVLGLVFCGIINGFNIYAVALKQTFNYTQTELEYIAASGIVGSELTSYFAGIAIDRFGPRSTCVAAAVLTCSCFSLMWMTTKFISFFASRTWIICLMYFMASSGCCFTNMVCMGTISLNFEGKHRGKIVGFASAVYGSSPLIYAAIYQGFFVSGHITDEQNQNIADFFILLSICAAIANVLGAGFLKIMPLEPASAGHLEMQDLIETNHDEDTSLTPIETNNDKDKLEKGDEDLTNAKNSTSNEKTPILQNDLDSNKNTPTDKIDIKPDTDITCFQMVKTLEFHFLLWTVIIIKGIGLTFTANITTIAKSAHLEKASSTLIIIIPISNTLARFFGGLMPDIFKQKLSFIPTSSLLLLASFISMTVQVLLVFFNQSYIGLACLSIMSSIPTGLVSVLMVIIILELFGRSDFSQKYGLVLTVAGIAAFPIGKIFGLIYENNSIAGSRLCYGVDCSRWSYIINAIFALLATLLSAALVRAEHKIQS